MSVDHKGFGHQVMKLAAASQRGGAEAPNSSTWAYTTRRSDVLTQWLVLMCINTLGAIRPWYFES